MIEKLKKIRRMAKAIIAGPYAGAMYLTGIWSEAESFNEAFSTMTPNQWVLLGITILGGWGVTYAVRNTPNHQSFHPPK